MYSCRLVNHRHIYTWILFLKTVKEAFFTFSRCLSCLKDFIRTSKLSDLLEKDRNSWFFFSSSCILWRAGKKRSCESLCIFFVRVWLLPLFQKTTKKALLEGLFLGRFDGTRILLPTWLKTRQNIKTLKLNILFNKKIKIFSEKNIYFNLLY